MAKKSGVNGSAVHAAFAMIRALEEAKEEGRWFWGAASFKTIRYEVHVDEQFDGAMFQFLRRWGRDRGMTDAEILEAQRSASWAPEAQVKAARHAVENHAIGRIALITERGLQAEPLPEELVSGEVREYLLSRPAFIDQVFASRLRLRRLDEEVKLEAGEPSGTGSSGTESEHPGSPPSGSASGTPSPS